MNPGQTRRSWGTRPKDRMAAMVAAEVCKATSKRTRSSKARSSVVNRKKKARVAALIQHGQPDAVRPDDRDMLEKMREVPTLPVTAELLTLDAVREHMDKVRSEMMARAVKRDVLDPGSLDGELTLPTEVLALIQKEDFSPDDLKRCVMLLGRDNLAYMAALFRSKDQRVVLEAMRLLRDIIYGNSAKVEHSGPDGGPVPIVIKLVAPDGTNRTIDRPRIVAAKDPDGAAG